jgi:1,6-anhydro-N-acetylmuramate kinase
VGNLTWVDPRAEAPEAPGALLAFDTGPANAPMDDLMPPGAGRRATRAARWPRRGKWTPMWWRVRSTIGICTGCRQSRWTGTISPIWPRLWRI